MRIINIFITFLLISFASANVRLFAVDEVESSNSIITTAIKEELSIETINFKPLGAGEGIMLEGTVSSKEAVNDAEEISKQYIDKVFNLVSISMPEYTFKIECAEYNNQVNLKGGSRYADILKQGSDMKSPWYFSFFDNQELESFKKDLQEIFLGNFLTLNIPRDIRNSSTVVSFKINDELFKISLDINYLDNGFFCTQCSFGYIENQKFVSLMDKKIYSRKGEWIAVTGFSEQMKNENINTDIIILFKPEMRGDA